MSYSGRKYKLTITRPDSTASYFTYYSLEPIIHTMRNEYNKDERYTLKVFTRHCPTPLTPEEEVQIAQLEKEGMFISLMKPRRIPTSKEERFHK